MLSRQETNRRINIKLNYDVMPEELCPVVHEFLDRFILDGDPTPSQICRFIYTSEELVPLTRLPQTTLAIFLRCSVSLVNHQAVRWIGSSAPLVSLRSGRPKYLTDSSEAKILHWLTERCAAEQWPTTREFKHRILAELENNRAKITPSDDFCDSIMKRIMGDSFMVRRAVSIDDDRFNASSEVIVERFKHLRALQIDRIDPRLIFNIDETGFGSSKRDKSGNYKVIVPSGFIGSPVTRERHESHFVSAIACISAAGEVLRPGLITKRLTDHPDGEGMSYISSVNRYQSEKAFISRKIFGDYLRQVVFETIVNVRLLCKDPDRRAIIFFDGHKSHLIDELNAFAAHRNIIVYCLPPHSSHLIQSLDQGFFRRIKSQNAQFDRILGVSKISSTLERVWMSFQASRVTRIVWNSWNCSGLRVAIKNGMAHHLEVDEVQVLASAISDTPALS